jgi:hypothetical protein
MGIIEFDEHVSIIDPLDGSADLPAGKTPRRKIGQ